MVKTKKYTILDNAPFLIISSIFLQSFSFLSIKISTQQSANLYILLWLLLAFLFIGSRAIIWQRLLVLTELSKVYPYTSLVQVLIFFYAVVFFHESVMLHHILGLLIMLVGLVLITKSR